VALSWALLRLFCRTRFTRLPTLLRHVLDLPTAPLLTTALVAGTPGAPFGPLARVCFWARMRCKAVTEPGQRSFAWPPTILGFLYNLSFVYGLAWIIATRDRAPTPFFPCSQLAVRRMHSVFPGRACAVWHLFFAVFIPTVASFNVRQSTVAPRAVPRSIMSDCPITSLDAPAAAGAVTPVAPVRKVAVNVRTAAVLVAGLELLVQTFWDAATLIRLLRDHSRFPPKTTAARSRARPPVTPRAPLTINTGIVVTGVRVAFRDLGH